MQCLRSSHVALTSAKASSGSRALRSTPASRGARRALHVQAIQEPDRQEAGAVGFSMTDLRKNCDAVMRRYDFVSAGLGALAVTTFCVSRGQDTTTALWITAASTVAALLANDLFFED